MNSQDLLGKNQSLVTRGDSSPILSESEQKNIAAFFLSFESKLTAKEYYCASHEFLSFVARDIDSVRELRRDHLILFQKYLQENGLAQKTIKKKISAVFSFPKYLAHEGKVEKDLSYGLKRPKSHNKRETADFTDEEVKKLFASLNPKRQTFYAHRAILAVGFYTRLRSREIVSLKMGNIGEVKGHRILNLKIKGDKPHEVPLNSFAWHRISEHIEKLKEWGFDIHDPTQCLFPRLKPLENKPITQQGLICILKSRMLDAGIKKSSHRRYSPHSMRVKTPIFKFHYRLGTKAGVEYFTEEHELGLFTKRQMKEAFTANQLEGEFDSEGLFGRGLYIGKKRMDCIGGLLPLKKKPSWL